MSQRIVILHKTSAYRGDHSADLAIAIEFVIGETIETLIHRLSLQSEDWIEIRVTQPISPAVNEKP